MGDINHSPTRLWLVFILAPAEWHSWFVRQPSGRMQPNVHSPGCVSIDCPQCWRAHASKGRRAGSVWSPAVHWGERGVFTGLLLGLCRTRCRAAKAQWSTLRGWMACWANHGHMVLLQCPLLWPVFLFVRRLGRGVSSLNDNFGVGHSVFAATVQYPPFNATVSFSHGPCHDET